MTLSQTDADLVHSLRLELLRQFADVAGGIEDDFPDELRVQILDLAARAARTDCSLTDLARLANEGLAWDSQSFVNFLMIDTSSIRADDLTRTDYERLKYLNGGVPLLYNLENWST